MTLRLHAVTFAYPDAHPVLENADLTIGAGEFLLVRGASGTGKSTLLRLLCRLELPVSGHLSLDETPYEDIDPTMLRRRVAHVQQTPTLIQGAVRDNLLLPYRLEANADLPVPDEAAMRAAMDDFLLESVHLGHNAAELSVGQAQRVCLLRTLLLSPEVLLMDEPTSALDPDSARVVLDAARKQHDRGTTVVLVSHSETVPPDITGTITLADRKAVLA